MNGTFDWRSSTVHRLIGVLRPPARSLADEARVCSYRWVSLLLLGLILSCLSDQPLSARAVPLEPDESVGSLVATLECSSGNKFSASELTCFYVLWRGTRVDLTATSRGGEFSGSKRLKAISSLSEKLASEAHIVIRGRGIRDVGVWVPTTVGSHERGPVQVDVLDLPGKNPSGPALTLKIRLVRLESVTKFQLLEGDGLSPVAGVALTYAAHSHSSNIQCAPPVTVTTDDQGVFEVGGTGKEFRIFFPSPPEHSHLAVNLRGVPVPITRGRMLFVTHRRGRPAHTMQAGPVEFGGSGRVVPLILMRSQTAVVRIKGAESCQEGEPVWLHLRPLQELSEPVELDCVQGGCLVGDQYLQFRANGAFRLQHLPIGQYSLTVCSPNLGVISHEFAMRAGGVTVDLEVDPRAWGSPSGASGENLAIIGDLPIFLSQAISNWAWAFPLTVEGARMGWVDGQTHPTGEGPVSFLTSRGDVSVHREDKASRHLESGVQGRLSGFETMSAEASNWFVGVTTVWGGENRVLRPEPKFDELLAVPNIDANGQFQVRRVPPGVYTFCVARFRVRSNESGGEIWELSINRKSVRLVTVPISGLDIGDISIDESGWEPFTSWKSVTTTAGR